MFRELIQTPMTSAEANSVFDSKICGDSWQGDTTFLSTLRALLCDRMGDDDFVGLSFKRTSYSKSQVEGIDKKSLVVSAMTSSNPPGTIVIHNLAADDDGNNACLDILDAEFTHVFPTWKRVEKVTAFFHKVFRVSCFINPEMKSVIVYVSNMDSRKMHYLQCGIFAFLPWYFDQKQGATEDELALIYSLREKNATEYNKCIEKFAKKYDFRKLRITRLLTGFETKFEQVRLEQEERNVIGLTNEIDRLNTEIGEIFRRKRELDALIAGLRIKIQESDPNESEIMNYFLHNKHLVLEDVNGTELTFVAMDHMTYFDEDEARHYLDKNTSVFFRYGSSSYAGDITTEQMKHLLEEIFVKQRIKIRFCAAYRFRIDGNVRGLRGYTYPVECNQYTPNPHIDEFACLGGYEAVINRKLKDHDYLGAIEQSIASAKSLNLGDSTVMSRFMAKMYSTTERFLELPDGKVVNPLEAIAFLAEEHLAAERAAKETEESGAEAEQ